MRIYTKTGDQGETGLFGGGRVRKDHLRIAAYGDVDELNAVIGVARSQEAEGEAESLLKQVQNTLFQLGAILASPDPSRLGSIGATIDEEDLQLLEKEIDRMEASLPPLRTFILPGGSALAATLHVARTVCRRAERHVVALAAAEKIDGSLVRYLNRLSDFFFVLARQANQKAGVADVAWVKKEKTS